MSKRRFKHFADLGITREEVVAAARASGDPALAKMADSLAKRSDWTPDKLFVLLADFLGKDPEETLK